MITIAWKSRRCYSFVFDDILVFSASIRVWEYDSNRKKLVLALQESCLKLSGLEVEPYISQL